MVVLALAWDRVTKVSNVVGTATALTPERSRKKSNAMPMSSLRLKQRLPSMTAGNGPAAAIPRMRLLVSVGR